MRHMRVDHAADAIGVPEPSHLYHQHTLFSGVFGGINLKTVVESPVRRTTRAD